jgi:2-deoxy-D-gluconate 3-dehydrogenase
VTVTKNPFDLSGRVALVTGGTAGIGLGMAEGLLQAGARVMLAGRDAARGAAAQARLGDAAMFVQADVAQRDDCIGAVAATVARLGRLDILVNNAGTTARMRPETLQEADWRRVIDTNLSAALFCSQAAYPEMRRQGGGKIVMVGSLMSLFGAPYAAAYAASKGGVVQLARALATAWAEDRIQVNVVLPGWIDTKMTEGARAYTPGLFEAATARTPAGRWGQPADLAGIAVFLASAASDFVTGTAIPVDGGYSIRG